MGEDSVYLGLGSNLGDKADNCRRALELISASAHTQLVAISSFYKTAPVGYLEQDWFINCAVRVNTILPPHKLRQFLQGIEGQMGRVRTFPMGPRLIDIDILLYGDMVISEGDLTIPHPRLHERAFVLVPLAELAPELSHPILHKTIRQLLDKKGTEGVEPYLPPPQLDG